MTPQAKIGIGLLVAHGVLVEIANRKLVQRDVRHTKLMKHKNRQLRYLCEMLTRNGEIPITEFDKIALSNMRED